MTDKFDHVVHIDEAQRKLRIDRLYLDGRKILYTEVDIPSVGAGDKDTFTKFATMLGENLLLDSILARKLFKL